MKNQIRKFKKQHLQFLKNELDKNNDESVLSYLHACIDVLEHELEDKKVTMVANDKRVMELLLTADFTENEALLLSMLLCNNTIPTSKMLHTNIERGKSYRVLNKLISFGIVDKTNTAVVEYFVIDKYNPFKDMIAKINYRSTKLKNVSAKIIKLLN